MTTAQETKSSAYQPSRPKLRFAKYAAGRLLLLSITVVAGLYFALLGANLGGKIDELHWGNLYWGAAITARQTLGYHDMSPAQRTQLTREIAVRMGAAMGLDRHITVRVAEWLPQGLTLQLGESGSLRSIRPRMPSEERLVRVLIVERIPNTLLLMGVTNLVFFCISLSVGLFLSRRYRSWLDKLFVWLSPLSAAPSWFYGIFLVAVVARVLRLPAGGMYPVPPPESRILYVLGMLRHMILPFTAVFLSMFFYSVYMWRTFFLIHSGEDYVELARAKGLPDRMVSRRYILRPTLPAVLTNFAVTLLSVWSGSILLERLFNWPGLGDLYFKALVAQDTAVIVGLTIIYAYFLALTLFILDIAYALVDPRIRAGKSKGAPGLAAGKPVRSRRRLGRWPFRRAARPRRLHPRRAAGAVVRQFRTALRDGIREIPAKMQRLGKVLWGLRRHPTALVGLSLIFLLSSISVYTLIALPYEEVIILWRAEDRDWQDSPRNARPVWTNFFSRTKLPPTLILDSREDEIEREVALYGEVKDIRLTYTFDYHYDAYPHEPMIYIYPVYEEKLPHVTLTWVRPDGQELELAQLTPQREERHYFFSDSRFIRRLQGLPPQEALFAVPEMEPAEILQGTYQLRVEALFFEEEVDIEARLVIPGQVHGWAGTDSSRRDLGIALLWGMPLALSFGLLGALSTTLLTMVLAAVGVWWGGWVDELIQRLTEAHMVLPIFPILAMFTSFFILRLWEVLGLAILFGIFNSSLKTYRALFLQIKQSPFIEAAQAYGASDTRIVLRYLLPRVLPVLVPQIILQVPAYVFLETAITFLGLGDILLPTWGKVLNDAIQGGALYAGHYHWILQPAFLLLLTTFAFAMTGFTLDRVLNPRLQEA